MKKLLVITLLSILLVSCGAKTDKKVETQKQKNIETQAQKFKDLTKYIKSDITDEESDELVKILEQRIERQAEIKKMIEEATKETAGDVYEKIREKRTTCMNRILPYVDKVKVSSFKKYCEKINFAIKNKLDEK